MRWFWIALAMLLPAGAAQPAPSAGPVLRSGDRLAFLGDSITQQRIYTRYVMNYLTLRYPDANITFRNFGWGGERAPGGLARLERDLLPVKPDVVSICYGMNDGGVKEFDRELYAEFMDGMTGLVAKLKEEGIRVVLLPPGVVDPDRKNWNAPERMAVYNPTLTRFGQGVEALARREKLPYYDLNALMLEVQRRAKADDPEFTMIPDGVHPSEPGQALMAYALIKALGCEGPASSLTIDAEARKSRPNRCRLRDEWIGPVEISFVRTDEGLPAWFDPEAESIFAHWPIHDEINTYMFKVTGLRGERWRLSVDGTELGIFSPDELAAGIDLAAYAGPWRKLAEQVDRLSREQEALWFKRWREVALNEHPEGPRARDAELAELDRKISAIEQERARLMADRTWKWSLDLRP